MKNLVMINIIVNRLPATLSAITHDFSNYGRGLSKRR